MNHLRLGLALTILAFAGNAQSAPVDSPQDEVLGHLAAAFASDDPARITHAYRTMGEYALPAADIVESKINAMGYELLENGEIDAAIKVFDLNANTFPTSAKAWDSLAEAVMTKGAYESAIRYYRVSLALDPEGKNAAEMIERMTSKQQFSQLSSIKI